MIIQRIFCSALWDQRNIKRAPSDAIQEILFSIESCLIMRFLGTALVSAIVFSFFVALSSAERQNHRQKRFLNTDAWPILPDSLLRFGDYARVLTDQISSQASMAVQQMMPQATRTISGLAPLGSRRLEQAERPSQKRGLTRVPVGRETEGDEKEVELFNPGEEVEKPPRPGTNDHDDDQFHPFIPFSFSFGLLAPWWEGPNICVERNEVDEPTHDAENVSSLFTFNFESTSCTPSETSYVCSKKIQTNGMRKTIVIRKQCCHGYIRRTDGRPGCSALKMDNIIDTMKVLEMTKFLHWVDQSGLQEKLLSGNYTVFTPSNEAITDFEDETEDNEISAIDPVRLTDVTPVVLGHIVEGFINVDVLENEHLLDTLDESSKIRINKYEPAHKVITANCIPISGKNNFATNGIIHLTSGVLSHPTRTIGDIIQNDDQYSILHGLLKDSDLMDKLKKEDKAWTIFAPTDAAFRKLPRALRKQIESGEACVQSILHQHLVQETICTSAVVSQIRVKNILENNLQLTRDEAEKLRVDGVLIDSENSMGTNGVIHSIDKVLIPPQARNLLKALEEEERTDMLDLIEAANLISMFEEMQNVTFFVPSKEAVANLPNETLLEMENDPELKKKIILSHLVFPHTTGSMFTDNKRLTTKHGHDIHLKLHEVFPGLVTGATVQCAYIVSHDHPACGAVIHKINKVLMPPKGSIVETLKNMEDHDIVMKLLQETELEKKLEEDGPFTFLAPTNEAFEKMHDVTLDELLENKTKAEAILKLHVLPEMLCCNGISHASPFNRQFVRTYDGSILPLHRGLSDRVRFGRARALQCDMSATNGLIHSINRVILPQRPRTNVFGMDFWPFF